jgi:hypothetical protein
MIKVYFYTNRGAFIQSNYDWTKDLIPFQEMKEEGWVRVYDPLDCDFYHCGQINDLNEKDYKREQFEFLDKFPEKHIFDIEGDWTGWCGRGIPEELQSCLFTINGAHQKYSKLSFLLVRPTFSTVFLDIIRSNFVNAFSLKEKQLRISFVGKIGNNGTRQLMAQALTQLPQDSVSFISRGDFWAGHIDPDHKYANEYRREMENNLIQLCPRGEGLDSVRFYEACAYGCVPVLIGDNLVMGHDFYDLSFMYRFPSDISATDLKNELIDIYNYRLALLIDRAKRAYEYFNSVVLPYLNNPTAYFLDYIAKK